MLVGILPGFQHFPVGSGIICGIMEVSGVVTIVFGWVLGDLHKYSKVLPWCPKRFKMGLSDIYYGFGWV